jgi:hypothetical protein
MRIERRGLGDEPRAWEQVSLEVTVRRVCATCNNGWLSALEDRAKPLLEPLILGPSRTLSAEESEMVALWCVKTALLFQFIHPERRQAPDEHFRFLCDRGVPPPNTFVWLAGYNGVHWSGWYMHQILELHDPRTGETSRGYCETVATGALVFQVTSFVTLEPAEIEKASEQAPYIAQVWPSKGATVTVPPQLHLDDRTLPQFADPFGAENTRDLLA